MAGEHMCASEERAVRYRSIDFLKGIACLAGRRNVSVGYAESSSWISTNRICGKESFYVHICYSHCRWRMGWRHLPPYWECIMPYSTLGDTSSRHSLFV